MLAISSPWAFADEKEKKIIKNPDKSIMEQMFFLTKEGKPFWLSKSLTSATSNKDVLNGIIKQIRDKGMVVDEQGTEVARLTGYDGLLITPSYVVLGGGFEPVFPINRKNRPRGEKYIGYLNKNCFLVVKGGKEELTLTPLLNGEYSKDSEYVDFDKGPITKDLNIPRPLINKLGQIIGWGRNSGYVYDNAGNMLGIGSRCETITINIANPTLD